MSKVESGVRSPSGETAGSPAEMVGGAVERVAGTPSGMIPVASLSELETAGQIVVRGAERPIVVFYNGGQVCAVDNRCPHMGFPLAKGECVDGVITCPWHYARFEAHSGCTFDAFAGDVEPFDVEIRDGRVFVSSHHRPLDRAARAWRRFREGMETNNSLVTAKAILELLGFGKSTVDILREAALFGARMRDGWGQGLTSLTALGRLDAHLTPSTRYFALFQGVRRVAAECQGASPHRRRYPLESARITEAELQDWMHTWFKVRHRDAGERTLLTGVNNGLSPAAVSRLVMESTSDRIYADTGHVMDFSNKAFELLEIIGWDHAADVLPTLMPQWAGSRGGEEQDSWHRPVELTELIASFTARVPELLGRGAGRSWNGEAELGEKMTSAVPAEIVTLCEAALSAGATMDQLAASVTYAAALRMARFGSANEIGDWVTALHTLTYCHAVHAAAVRVPGAPLGAAVIQGAMSMYLDRFLNIPPAKLPEWTSDLPETAASLLEGFLNALNHRTHDELAARHVKRYLDLGFPVSPLIDALVQAVTREDADFHLFQMVEAAATEWEYWDGRAPGKVFFIAAARYIAASAPTQRTQMQTAQIAWRLHRGEKVYEDEPGEGV